MDVTGADMILSAHRLLQGESPVPDGRATVASRHKTTLGQDLRGKFTRFMVTPGLAECVSRVPDGAMLSAYALTTFHQEAFVYVISSVTMVDGEKWVEQTLPAPLAFEGYEQAAALFRW